MKKFRSKSIHHALTSDGKINAKTVSNQPSEFTSIKVGTNVPELTDACPLKRIVKKKKKVIPFRHGRPRFARAYAAMVVTSMDSSVPKTIRISVFK